MRRTRTKSNGVVVLNILKVNHLMGVQKISYYVYKPLISKPKNQYLESPYPVLWPLPLPLDLEVSERLL